LRLPDALHAHHGQIPSPPGASGLPGTRQGPRRQPLRRPNQSQRNVARQKPRPAAARRRPGQMMRAGGRTRFHCSVDRPLGAPDRAPILHRFFGLTAPTGPPNGTSRRSIPGCGPVAAIPPARPPVPRTASTPLQPPAPPLRAGPNF